MIKRLTGMITLACVCILGMALAGSAADAQSTSSQLTYHFTDCSGPEGTPATFDAVKQSGGAAALHLVQDRAIFVAMEAIDLATGDVLFTTKGFRHNGLPTVTCQLIHPVTLTLQRVTGIITADEG